MGFYCITISDEPEAKIYSPQMGIGLLFMCLLFGVMPFILVWYFCDTYTWGCHALLWMFGILMTAFGIITISVSCAVCWTHKCGYERIKESEIV